MSSVADRLQKKAPRPSSTKQVRLKLVYVDFWSVLKLSFLISVALGIVTELASEDAVLGRAVELAAAQAGKDRKVIAEHKRLLYGPLPV